MLIRIMYIATLVFHSSFSWALSPGEPAPDCKAPDLNGTTIINLDDYKGKVVYLDFWASWCPSCKQSFAALNQLHNDLSHKGFEVVAINLDQERQEAEQFLSRQPVDFSIAYDGLGICPTAFQVKAMPSSFLIDRQGVIREIHLGYKEGDIDKIRSKVTALVSESRDL